MATFYARVRRDETAVDRIHKGSLLLELIRAEDSSHYRTTAPSPAST